MPIGDPPPAISTNSVQFDRLGAPRLTPEVEDFITKAIERLVRETLDRLEARLLIERAEQWAPLPKLPLYPAPPMPTTCSGCGIQLGQVMGYCCPRNDCPTGMGPLTC